MGYLIEAQELEVYKSDLSEIGTEFYSGEEKEDDQAVKIAEYEKLLNEGISLGAQWLLQFLKLFLFSEHPSYVYNTKNTEALRASIVNTTIRISSLKACMHCREAMKTVKYSYGKLVISVSKADMKAF